MRVDFDLSLLSQGILGEFGRAMAAMQSAIPVLALQVDPWLTKELERRQKAAKGEAVKPVTMLVPLLDEKELSRGMACLIPFSLLLRFGLCGNRRKDRSRGNAQNCKCRWCGRR